MKLLKFALFLVFLLLGFQVFSQDVIKLKDGRKINAVITEINDYEIKYHEYNDPNKLIFSISRGLVDEVKFEYGKVIKESERQMNDEAYYVNDKISNIKLNFTALGGAVTVLTYERAIDQFSSIEGSVKLNGLGVNNDLDKEGFGLNVGYKVKAGRIFKARSDYRPNHILHGSYFRPGIGFNLVSSINQFSYNSYSYFNFGLDYGKQWILNNILSIDLYIGYNYFLGSAKNRAQGGDDFNDFEFADGDLVGGNNIALSYGLRLGILFEKNKKSKKARR